MKFNLEGKIPTGTLRILLIAVLLICGYEGAAYALP